MCFIPVFFSLLPIRKCRRVVAPPQDSPVLRLTVEKDGKKNDDSCLRVPVLFLCVQFSASVVTMFAGTKVCFCFFVGGSGCVQAWWVFFSVPQESAETKVPVSSSPPLFCVFVFVLKGGHYLGLFFHCAAPMCHVLCFLTSVHGGFSQVREEKQARYRGFFFLRRVGEAVSCVVKTRVADLGMHLCYHCETFLVPGLFIPCQEPLASHRNTKRKKKSGFMCRSWHDPLR